MSVQLPFVDALIGKKVGYAWIGYGSAVFLEFGDLIRRTGRGGELSQHFQGDITLMIEWSWRVERVRSIFAGSWSSKRRWQSALRVLIGCEVTQVAFTSGLPEIALSFSNGLRITSFMTAEGQPAWAIIARSPKLGSLHVLRGRLCISP